MTILMMTMHLDNLISNTLFETFNPINKFIIKQKTPALAGVILLYKLIFLLFHNNICIDVRAICR